MTGLIAEPISKEHITGWGHPETPERFDAALSALQDLHLERLPGRAATEEELLLCHEPSYVQQVQRDVQSGAEQLSTGDTAISERSWDVALVAAGSVLHAVDAVMAGTSANAFCLNRPPGHHATPDRGMGFCLFNNVALGARYAQRKHSADRVLIADWDVHHGNGTQDIFYDDGTVFFFSTHQSPWYPGTGAADETGFGSGEGWIRNCPLPAGSGRREILGAFQGILLKEAERVRPDLVMISAGFDSREGDPLGNFLLTDRDFVDLTHVMMEIADRYAGGRIVSVLEGGYSLSGLAAGVRAHVAAMAAKNGK